MDRLWNKANLKIAMHKGMKVGKNFNMPDKVYFGTEPELIDIGDNVRIAAGVRFVNHGGTANILNKIPGYEEARIVGRIKIGNNCMIGLNSVIMQDVQMGNNCILGANSVLSQSMPDNTVFVGNPAQFLCTIEDYGDIVLKNTPCFPKELEKNKRQLNKYLSENLPHKYKKARKI